MRLLFCIAGFSIGMGTGKAEDWPQWLGTKRDGIWRETGIVETFPKDGPKVVWRVPIGMGYTGPSVANGKVYVMDRVLDEGVSLPPNAFSKGKNKGKERVQCRDERTGDLLWKHEYTAEYAISYAAGPRCTPTVDGDRVYALGAMGNLFCLNAENGKPIWEKDFIKQYESFLPVWGFAAHPLIEGDKLICLVGGSNSRLVVAFDKKNGKELWATESCGGDFGYSPPMIYEFGGKRQLIIWHSHAVLGLEPENGKRIWRVDFESKAALTAPTARKIGDDELFVTSFYNGSMLLKVTAKGAAVVWKSKSKGEMPNQTVDLSSIMCTPIVDGDSIYGVCSYGQLRCIKAQTGERVWETMNATRGKLTPMKVAANEEPATTERWSNAFIVKQDDRYFLFNEQGDLIIARLSPKCYEEVSRAHLLDPTNKDAGRMVVWVHPAFANKCIFARNDKELICVSLAK
jgi:outer membrane protein assembly factor BamB